MDNASCVVRWRKASLERVLCSPCLDAFDNELIKETLQEILQGNEVQIPVYDFVTHSRSERSIGCPLVIFVSLLLVQGQDFYALCVSLCEGLCV